jgi:guanine nucleotide-binding protein G(i) subunit alpha
MGNLCSGALTEEEKQQRQWELARARQIDDVNKVAKVQDGSIKKILLLGAGESGKSTFFKQIITLYGKGYSQEELNAYRGVIFNNVLESMQTLLDANREFSDEWLDAHPEAPDEQDPFYIDLDDEVIELVEDAPEHSPITLQLGEAISALWKDEGVQATFDERANFQLMDTCSYYFDNIDRIADPGFQPTRADVYRCRVRTTGIVETTFELEGNSFKMFDVGGQRNERKKWIHCFEGVTVVLFIAAISEYDQVLWEDEAINRMKEALELFEDTINSTWFRETGFILFLNKKDLFEDKIKKTPLSVCDEFQDFPGPDGDYDAAVGYIREVFNSRNRTGNELYTLRFLFLLYY